MLARIQKSISQRFRVSQIAMALALAVAMFHADGKLFAQFGGGGGVFLGNGGVVGGVEINTSGVLSNQAVRLTDDIRAQIASNLKVANVDLKKPGTRMISLRALEKKMVECKNAGKPFPPEVRYMAGLQRIEYVIVNPENNDVILAGPGEGFVTDKQGNIVGEKSGMPVIHLEDFLVAMRSADNARRGHGISVSIDPTEAGVRNVQNLMRQFDVSSFNRDSARALEEAGGPQSITLTGVPQDSRFSQVLVSADYKMKRLAMGLEPAPEFLPSVLAMAKAKDSRFKKMTPRFWMECNYQPIAVSDDQMVWHLNGQGVAAKTETEIMQQDGSRKAAKPNKIAKKWADTMTDRYEELSRREPVFRELRNMMDLSVIAAIISKEKMLQKVSLDIPAIQGTDAVSTPKWNVPQTVPTQCSFTRLSRSLMITTSGGVTVNSWAVASNTKVKSQLSKVADTALAAKSDQWWWNAN